MLVEQTVRSNIAAAIGVVAAILAIGGATYSYVKLQDRYQLRRQLNRQMAKVARMTSDLNAWADELRRDSERIMQWGDDDPFEDGPIRAYRLVTDLLSKRAEPFRSGENEALLKKALGTLPEHADGRDDAGLAWMHRDWENRTELSNWDKTRSEWTTDFIKERDHHKDRILVAMDEWDKIAAAIDGLIRLADKVYDGDEGGDDVLRLYGNFASAIPRRYADSGPRPQVYVAVDEMTETVIQLSR